MTNIEFLIQIAKGFNPITGETFEETDILCQPEVSKRLLDLVKQLQEDEKVTFFYQFTFLACKTFLHGGGGCVEVVF